MVNHPSKMASVSLLAVTIVLCFALVSLAQQTPSSEQDRVDRLAGSLKKHVTMLSHNLHPRDYLHLENQEMCVKYIYEHFQKAGAKVTTQDVPFRGKTYQNVIARFGNGGGKRFIVGAHYDAPTGSPGADDNASAVAGLIELAYMLSRKAGEKKLEMDFEFVAYSLEEVGLVGSAAHAKSLKRESIDVVGMISLEMIGYFTDEPDSQDYPVEAMKLLYPSEGNFIAVIGRLDQAEFVNQLGVTMQGYGGVKTLSLAAPPSLSSLTRLSDHSSYWDVGYNAVMITDTAFLRNKEYHRPGDTADRLDYEKMAHVVLGINKVLRELPFEKKDDQGE